MKPAVGDEATEVQSLVQDRGDQAGLGTRDVGGASRDLDVHQNVLRRWGKGVQLRPGADLSRHSQMKPEQQAAAP